jgi:iron complex transport system substrate-binding protein
MGCRQQAEQIFEQIESRYNALRQMVVVAHKPKVMINTPWQDVWYVPRADNYMCRLIEDAGGECLFLDKRDTSKGRGASRAISNEQAFLWICEADIWLNPGSATTAKELYSIDKKFSSTKVMKTGAIFNNNLRLALGQRIPLKRITRVSKPYAVVFAKRL